MNDEVTQEPLVHCIYCSAAINSFTQEEILTMLEKARINNQRLDITGMLLYENGSFFQVLEGHPDTVTNLLNIIEKDKRHDQIIKIIYEPIESRDFSEWTMGLAGVTMQDLKNIDGLNDFFESGRRYIELDEGRAKTLLKAFKKGKWRAAIS